MKVSLFLEEEEEVQTSTPPSNPTTNATSEPDPETVEIPEEPLIFSDIEKKAKLYKIFMDLFDIFERVKTFNNTRIYSIKLKRDREEITQLIKFLDDKFLIAYETFTSYEDVEQIKIIKTIQNRLRKLNLLLKYKEK